MACGECDLIVPANAAYRVCPRCQAALHPRKPDAARRTAALLIAGYLLYVPANLLPVTTLQGVGGDEHHTIMSGVFELIHNDLWPLALIVFMASIVLPLVKLTSLTWMLIAVRRRSATLLRTRTRLYRTIDAVGRWSNIDVFMGSVLVALLQFGALTTVRAQSGLVAFAAVVVLTDDRHGHVRFATDVGCRRRKRRMTEQDSDDTPVARTRAHRWFAWVWAVPIVAGVIVLWLGARSYVLHGPDITISFRNVEGLQERQSTLRHRGVVVGTVERLEFTPDLSQVIVHARMTRSVKESLNENTRFYIVSPHVGLEGISGLSTIVSGVYIEMEPARGTKSVDSFEGLDEPPLLQPNAAGRMFTVTAPDLGSLSRGSPTRIAACLSAKWRRSHSGPKAGS